MNDYTECPFCDEGDACDVCDSTGVAFTSDISKHNRALTALVNGQDSVRG